MVNCIWAPTSRHVLTIQEFNIRLTVWSLTDKSVQYTQSPKLSESRGIAFSPNNKIMAVIEKNLQDGRDMVSLYDLSQSMNASKGPQNWVCLHQFYPNLVDADGIRFTQDGNHLMVWESPLKNSFQVYQIIFNEVSVVDINLIQDLQPYDSSRCLGLRELQMSPNKQFLLLGYCDQRMRMINVLSWKEVFAFNHGYQ